MYFEVGFGLIICQNSHSNLRKQDINVEINFFKIELITQTIIDGWFGG